MLRWFSRPSQWALAYAYGQGAAAGGFTIMRPPPGRRWADPFPVAANDHHVVFFEEFDQVAGKGRIAVIELHTDGRWTQPIPVLERSHHLSYPCVFDWQGERFMTPETAEAGEIRLYRCRSFPVDWVLERVIIRDVKAADPTMARIDDHWWLFACVGASAQRRRRDLCVYEAPSPEGPWRAHRANPVKSDVRSARPAGHLFERQGRWYRPSQDCSRGYGGAVTVNRIECLDAREYREVPTERVDPEWVPDALGLHTFNRAGELVMIDCRLPVDRPVQR